MSWAELPLNQRVFSHRGLWDTETSPNSIDALKKAQASSLGIETDIRLFGNQLVVSHDPIDSSQQTIPFDIIEFLAPIAINIKEDGLQKMISKKNDQIIQSDSFVFDGSIPDILIYKKLGINHALRISEYEQELPWQPFAIWLDAFDSDWWLKDKKILEKMKYIPTIVVSSELHGRPKENVWDKTCELFSNPNYLVGICTDYPIAFLDTLR